MEIQKIVDAVERGAYQELIATFESETVECKRTPYRLSEEAEKLELAKDVSALANASGGVILIGWATRKDDVHGWDQVSEVCAFPSNLFNDTQYTAVLGKWLWPCPNAIRVRSFPVADKPGYSVALVEVPPSREALGPILITTNELPDGRRTGLLFGYCERHRAAVSHFDLQRLQGLIRDGLRFESVLSNEFASIRALLHEGAREPPGSDVQADIESALASANLQSVPAFYLTARARPAPDLRGIFESRESPLVALLHEPPSLNRRGFGIDVDINSRIIEGRLRRAVIADDRVLEIHRDGLIVFACRGDEAGLCWNSRTERLRINQVALIEMTYLFVLLAYRAYAGKVDGQTELCFGIGFDRLRNAAGTACLSPGEVHWYTAGSALPAPSDSFYREIESKKSIAGPRTASLLLEEIYHWFGFDSSRIPYMQGDGEGRIVSVDALERIQ